MVHVKYRNHISPPTGKNALYMLNTQFSRFLHLYQKNSHVLKYANFAI